MGARTADRLVARGGHLAEGVALQRAAVMDGALGRAVCLQPGCNLAATWLQPGCSMSAACLQPQRGLFCVTSLLVPFLSSGRLLGSTSTRGAQQQAETVAGIPSGSVTARHRLPPGAGTAALWVALCATQPCRAKPNGRLRDGHPPHQPNLRTLRPWTTTGLNLWALAPTLAYSTATAASCLSVIRRALPGWWTASLLTRSRASLQGRRCLSEW